MRGALRVAALGVVLTACSQALSVEPAPVPAPPVRAVATSTTVPPPIAPPLPPATEPPFGERGLDPPSTAAPTSTGAVPSFTGAILAIGDSVAARMTASWRPGCPVGLADLRLLRITHHDFAGGVATGEIVVHADVAADVLAVFEGLFAAGYPIERMELVDVYGGDDDESMAANNTSGFNCRFVAGSNRWSEHAYGTAIDVNPLVNPHVRGSRVDPPAGAPYVDRSRDHPALITADGPAVEAFAAIGWTWGGTWRSAKDYQHFSLGGR